jgi:hypothetical protein
VLEFLGSLVKFGGKTRADLITSATQLTCAIQMASALSIMRLAQARAAATPAEKRTILAKLSNDEVGRMANLADLCSKIGAAANAFSHPSAEVANVNLGAHGLAKDAFVTLQDQEWGLQKIYTASLMPNVADGDLDSFIDERCAELGALQAQAASAVTSLTSSI